MNRKHLPIVVLCSLLFAEANVRSAEERQVAKGRLLTAYDFSKGQLGEEFVVKRGEWKVEGGVLGAKEIEAELRTSALTDHSPFV